MNIQWGRSDNSYNDESNGGVFLGLLISFVSALVVILVIAILLSLSGCASTGTIYVHRTGSPTDPPEINPCAVNISAPPCR